MVWMTSEALRALERERDQLEATPREHTQAQLVRLLHLRKLIQNADTTERADDGLVEAGMTVGLHFDDGTTDTFVLGERDILRGERVVSPASPLGSAVDGHRVGETIAFTTPAGAERTARIVAAVPHQPE